MFVFGCVCVGVGVGVGVGVKTKKTSFGVVPAVLDNT